MYITHYIVGLHGYDGKIDGGTTIKTRDCRSIYRVIVGSVMCPVWTSSGNLLKLLQNPQGGSNCISNTTLRILQFLLNQDKPLSFKNKGFLGQSFCAVSKCPAARHGLYRLSARQSENYQIFTKTSLKLRKSIKCFFSNVKRR